MVDGFLLQWREDYEFAENSLMALAFVRRLYREGVRPPLASAAVNYIDECRVKSMPPDRTELIWKILPWYRP